MKNVVVYSMARIVTLVIVFTSCLLSFQGLTQSVPLNDNCIQSFPIVNVQNFCSQGVAEYTTVNSTADDTGNIDCISTFQPQGVWYNFTAITRFTRLTLEGLGEDNELTLNMPILGVFEGNCDNLNVVNCVNSQSGANALELVLEVFPGTRYFIFVGGVNQETGTFRLCLNSFNQDPDPLQDCGNARVLCDKSPLGVESILGTGNVVDDLGVDPNPPTPFQFECPPLSEDASNWYKWTCDNTGTLEFTITPLKQFDDIDFIVYELPNGIEDCDTKIPLRLLFSGQQGNDPMEQWQVCVGPTGLMAGDDDAFGESCGCQSGDNNFGAPIMMESGKSYALLVMNFSDSGVGYNLEWGGTGTFQGPIPEFSVDPIEGLRCDQAFTIEDRSRDIGNPLEYDWYFGSEATPQTSDQAGPFSVEYTTYGQKYIVLTVTDPVNGCEVTEIFDIFAEPCCEDLEEVTANLVQQIDPTCPNYVDGSLELAATGGSNSGFTFSINNSPFVNGSLFENLSAGTYTIDIVDNKGCEGSFDVEIEDPDPIVVDAGIDTIVDLGESLNLGAIIVSENGRTYTITWEPPEAVVSGSTDLDPEVIPLGTTDYTIIITDEFGCTFTDRVRVEVDENYPIYIPNVFSPNEDGFNDRFTAYGNQAIDFISRLRIYDRWGNLVFTESNFPHSDDFNHGWDGRFNGDWAEEGVYTYFFEVQFIDGNPPREISGDITVIR